MSTYPIKEGTLFKSVWFPDEGELKVGQGKVLKIEVVLVHGQMAGVPWAKVYMDGTEDMLINLALVEGCVLMEDEIIKE